MSTFSETAARWEGDLGVRREENERKQVGKLWGDVARFEDVLGLLLNDSDFFMRTRRLENETNGEVDTMMLEVVERDTSNLQRPSWSIKMKLG